MLLVVWLCVAHCVCGRSAWRPFLSSQPFAHPVWIDGSLVLLWNPSSWNTFSKRHSNGIPSAVGDERRLYFRQALTESNVTDCVDGLRDLHYVLPPARYAPTEIQENWINTYLPQIVRLHQHRFMVSVFLEFFPTKKRKTRFVSKTYE